MPSEMKPFQMRRERQDVNHTTQNHLNAIDAEGRVHVIRVESSRHVTRTVRGVIVQTGGDRFFLDATNELLVLDPETARLHTPDGLREFTFKIG